VVNREHPRDHAHEDVFVALGAAFRAAGRRLEDHVRRLRGAEKAHAERSLGRISQLFPLDGYGFIKTADGRDVSFHHRFGSGLNRHAHLHAAVTDGVFLPGSDGPDGPPASFRRRREGEAAG